MILDSITFTPEELAEHLPPEMEISKTTVKKLLKRLTEMEDAWYRMNKKRLDVEVSERVKKGLYTLEMRVIERPLLSKEALCQLQKHYQKIGSSLKLYGLQFCNLLPESSESLWESFKGKAGWIWLVLSLQVRLFLTCIYDSRPRLD